MSKKKPIDPTEALARQLLSWKYGQEYAGKSLLKHVDDSGLMNPTANPRAIDAVNVARDIVSKLQTQEA